MKTMFCTAIVLLFFCVFSTKAGFAPHSGSFKYPPGCRYKCEYEASWTYSDFTDAVEYTIKAKVPRGQWAGVGFSKVNNIMPNSDCYTGYLSKHWWHPRHLNFHDRYLFGRSANLVPADAKQNAKLTSVIDGNGYLQFSFIRKRDTGDKFDVSLTEECVYVLYAWGGEGKGGSIIGPHKTAVVSKEKVCIGPRPKPNPCKFKFCGYYRRCAVYYGKAYCVKNWSAYGGGK